MLALTGRTLSPADIAMLVQLLVAQIAFNAPPPAVVGGRTTAVSAMALEGELPAMYRARWQEDDGKRSPMPRVSSNAVAPVVGALVGVSAMAAIGVGASAVGVDKSLMMLANAGLFDQDVLVTDLYMGWLDAANVVGLILLPMVAIYLATPDATAEDVAAAVDGLFNDVEACLVEAEICGPVSFDSSEDGMVCVEDYSSGKLRWECA